MYGATLFSGGERCGSGLQEPRRLSRSVSVQSFLFFLFYLVLSISSSAIADVLVPADLLPGDKYHLVFNSSTWRNAQSQDVNTYNNFVQTAADAAGIGASAGITWRAIVSTAGVAASDNAVVGQNTPVYNMNGQMVASGFDDLWDGNLAAKLVYDEYGAVNYSDVWTGSNPDGTRANGLTLGGATAWCGSPIEVNQSWVNWSTPATDLELTFYGLSQELTVPGTVINAGFNDAWYFPGTSGQGFLIVVYEDIPLVFLAWFTFDAERPAEEIEAILGDPGHRWLTAQGPFRGNKATLDLVVTRGGVFDSGEPKPQNSVYGTIEILFEDCTKGVLSYDIESLGLQGEVPIQRVSNSNVALCEALAEGI